MLIGHAAAAFAIIGGLATVHSRTQSETLALAITAAVFATLPDIDVLYPLYLIVVTDGLSLQVPATAFWTTINAFHRRVTHSFVIHAVIAAELGALAVLLAPPRSQAIQWRTITVGSAILSGATIGSLVLRESITGAVMFSILALTAAIIFLTIVRYTSVSPYILAVIAVVSLVSHPVGDLFTGTPPPLFYPLLPTVAPTRISLVADPTLNLLGVFLIEVALLGAAVIVYCQLTGQTVTRWRTPAFIAGFTAAVLSTMFPPPTLDAAYYFVGVTGGTAVGAAVYRWWQRPTQRGTSLPASILTGTMTLIVAGIVYAVIYLGAITGSLRLA